ncbi:hypothetical protein EMCRGX_G019960 [Ephydatia muelleri]|eukprot:Em0011g59a
MDNDVKDILDLDREPSSGSLHFLKEAIMGQKEPKKFKKTEQMMKRPTGMNREVYALLYSDNKDSNATSLIPTDTGCGYRQPKARLGRKQVRSWKWIPFTNPARQDGLTLQHWRRTADEGKDYAFAQFNKSVDVPSYTDEEYSKHLAEETWTKEETDHLFELCRRFDLRFIIIQDRFDGGRFQKRTIEDLKERYYSVCNRIKKAHNQGGEEGELVAFDAGHECRRKQQLERLLGRTKEQVAEEDVLLAELKKIETRKKEREKKQHDLQKLISAAEQNVDSTTQRATIKKSSMSKKIKTPGTPQQPKVAESSVVFKSYDKASGVTLRSSKMKTPMTLGQRKAKAIEQFLEEMHIGTRPMPTEQICVQFNELRNDILLLLDLKAACEVCEFDLQSLRHKCEDLSPTKSASVRPPGMLALLASSPDLPVSTPKRLSLSGSPTLDSPSVTFGRKRKLPNLDTAAITKKIRKA